MPALGSPPGLRLNAVFRWEIRPGSTFYAVWTRQQEDTRDPGSFALARLLISHVRVVARVL